MLDPPAPQDEVAADFMRHKGYAGLEPIEVERLEKLCWMYTYQLPEGELDLRVEWLPGREVWDVAVDDFRLTPSS